MLLRARYRVRGRAGAGGVGTVWRAEDLCAGTTVALKALFPRDGDERLVGALRDEFGVLARLRHPQFARVFDFGRLPPATEIGGPEGRPGYFLTREFLDGTDLAAASDGLPAREIAGLCGEVALALDVLHGAGMLHGDLKPQNVIVEPAEGGRARRVRLIDFGLARAEGQARTASGTVAYVAPEVLREQPVDRRADLYALGIVFCELLTGELPVRGSSIAAMMNWHLEGPPVRAREARPDLPPAFDDVLARLADRDRERRFATAREAAAALLALAGADLPPPSPPPPPLVGRARVETLTALEDLVRARLIERVAGPPVVVLAGERGAGKTTLLRELAWRTQLQGAEAITGEFQTCDARPLGALGALLDQVAALAARASPLHEEPTQAGRFAMHAEVARFLAAAARKTSLLLLLDGVERASADARGLLRYLLHALDDAPGLLVVAAVASESPARADLADAPSLALGALDAAEVAELIDAAVARESAPGAGALALHARRDEALAARIHRHTGGAAGFVVEVAERIAREKGDPSRVALPGTIEEAIVARLAELPAPALRAAEVLAVFGRPLPPERLPGGTDALRVLEEAALVDRLPAGAVLRTGAAARILLDRAPRRWRQDMHRKAARECDGAEACRHWIEAGEVRAARRLAWAALDELCARGAHAEAIDLGEALLDALPARDAERRRLRLRVGEIARQAGDFERAERHAAAAGGPEGLVLQGRVRAEAGDFDGALALLGRAARTGTRRVDALRAVAEAHVRRGRPGDAEEVCRRALALRPAEADEAFLRAQLGLALGYRGATREAQEEFRRALDRARAAPDRPSELAALAGSALVHYRKGERGAARARWTEALEAARSIGDVERVMAIELNLAGLAYYRGELARQLEGLRACLRLALAVGARITEVHARVNLGYAQLYVGLVEEARAGLGVALEAARRLGMRRQEAGGLQVLGLVRAARGDAPGARAEMERVEAMFEELGDPVALGELLADRADVELRAGDAGAARRAWERAEKAGSPSDNLALRLAALGARLAAVGAPVERDAAAERIAAALETACERESPPLEVEMRAAAFDLELARGRDGEVRAHASAAVRLLEAMAADLPGEVRNAFWQDDRRRMLRDASRAAVGDAETVVGIRPGAPNVEMRFFRVLEVNRQLNSEHDAERLLERIMDAAVELTGAERGFLLLERGDGDLDVEVARNVDRTTLDAQTYSRSIAERVFRQGEPVITVSAHDDPRFTEYLSVHQMRLESVLAIPLHVRGRRAGVLYMESRFSRGPFTPDDLRLLQAFGDQAAIALSNARATAELVSRARELERARRDLEAVAEERRQLLERRTGELERARVTLAEMRERLAATDGRFGLVGRSPVMQRVFDAVERVAAVEVPALIVGESGTGKEMVARAIHEHGPRRERPFVAVNCAAIPESLLESELFGHVRGAFTGADRDRPGLFQAAQGGTLLLDEIGDMPARMQVNLLRALQERRIRPVGAESEVGVDARVLAASQRSLEDLVREGRFREDLFYRLNVVAIRLPPLRDRAEDIPLLVDHILDRIAARGGRRRKSVARDAMRRLMAERWPGNVRQLEHMLLNATVMQDGDTLDVEDFQLGARPSADAPAATVAEHRDEERLQILRALEAAGWNRTRAAAVAGVPRRTFYRRLREFGIL